MEQLDSPENRQRLEIWFARKLAQSSSDVTISAISRLSTGHSNDTFSVALNWREDGVEKAQVLVLRTRPDGVGLLEPYDVGKQFRVMKALEGSNVPVPKMYWLQEDESVIGKPFFVMEKLDGVIIEQEVPEYVLKADAAKIRRMCHRYVETIAAIHNLNWRDRGLDFLGDGSHFLDREIAWWEGEVRRAQRGPLPSMDLVMQWLWKNKPAQCPRITLVHGDAKWGNLLLQDEAVVAMLDWEMTTIGDPLTDVGWCTWLWERSLVGVPAQPGALAKQDVVELYEQLTGIKVENLVFYEVLEGFKMAAILFVGAMLFDSGRSPDLRYVGFGQGVPALLDRLLEMIGVQRPVEHGMVAPSVERVVAGVTDTVNQVLLPEISSHFARIQALTLARLLAMFAMPAASPPSGVSLEEEVVRAAVPR